MQAPQAFNAKQMFKTKHVTVEAIRWDHNSGAIWDFMGGPSKFLWRGGRHADVFVAEPLTYQGGRWVGVTTGDWIVKRPASVGFDAVTDADFANRFEAA